MSACTVDFKPETLRRLAELLRVDEVTMLGTVRPELVFALRIETRWLKASIPEDDFLCNPNGFNLIYKVLVDTAAALRAEVNQAARVTLEFVSILPPYNSEPNLYEAWMERTPQTMYSVFGLPADELSPAGQRIQVDEPPRRMDRFEAIAAEMEDA